MESNASEPEEITDFVEVPSLISAFKCGFDQKYYSEDMEYIMIPGKFLKHVTEPYVIKASGDSMSPTILDGDTLIVDRQAKYKHRDIIVCRLNDQFLVKQFVVNNFSTFLKSENNDFEIRKIMPDDEFEVLGKVISILRDI